MRPSVTTLNAIIGAVQSEKVKRELSKMPQNQKDKLISEIVKALLPNLGKFSARLGDDKFTIVVCDDDANYIRSRAKNLEKNVSDILESRV